MGDIDLNANIRSLRSLSQGLSGTSANNSALQQTIDKTAEILEHARETVNWARNNGAVHVYQNGQQGDYIVFNAEHSALVRGFASQSIPIPVPDTGWIYWIDNTNIVVHTDHDEFSRKVDRLKKEAWKIISDEPPADPARTIAEEAGSAAAEWAKPTVPQPNVNSNKNPPNSNKAPAGGTTGGQLPHVDPGFIVGKTKTTPQPKVGGHGGGGGGSDAGGGSYGGGSYGGGQGGNGVGGNGIGGDIQHGGAGDGGVGGADFGGAAGAVGGELGGSLGQAGDGGFADNQLYGSDGGTVATINEDGSLDTSNATSNDSTTEVYGSDGSVVGVQDDNTGDYYGTPVDNDPHDAGDAAADAAGEAGAGAGGGASSPNPDDGSDESPHMRGLRRRTLRRADKFTNQGFAPGQTSAVFKLLEYSSAHLGDDGGGVNPRFMGADPDSNASTSRMGRGMDPDSSGGGGSEGGMGRGDGGWQGGGGPADDATVGTGGAGGDPDPHASDDANLSGGEPTGADPENEWGAGGYNPHYQPSTRAWTPNQRVGGATRLVSSVRARVRLGTRLQ